MHDVIDQDGDEPRSDVVWLRVDGDIGDIPCGLLWVTLWMDGWMDEWMDGWTDGRLDGRMDGWMNGYIHN